MSESNQQTTVLPSDEEKAGYVRRMFSSVAPRYDLLNRLLSLGIDQRWRRRAVNRLAVERARDGVYLDSCAGTLDLAVEIARRPGFTGTVIGADFTIEMLRRGVGKIGRYAVHPACADALKLPFPDEAFDGIVVGFGVRNLADLAAGLREAARVLKPGGRFVILEFTTPRWQPFRAGYLFYFRRILPGVGKLVSKHGSAYTYLPESVLRFPEPPRLAEMMEEAGFAGVEWESLTGGIAALHVGEKT